MSKILVMDLITGEELFHRQELLGLSSHGKEENEFCERFNKHTTDNQEVPPSGTTTEKQLHCMLGFLPMNLMGHYYSDHRIAVSYFACFALAIPLCLTQKSFPSTFHLYTYKPETIFLLRKEKLLF